MAKRSNQSKPLPTPAEVVAAAVAEIEVDPIEAAAEKLAKRREWMRDYRVINDIASEKSFRRFLETTIGGTVEALEPPSTKYRPPKRDKGATSETMVQMLSDFHAYELIKASRTRGINAYTAEIFGKRARSIVERHISIKERMERGGGWVFKKLVIPLNGDIISGTIHELERHSDAPNVVMAVYGAAYVVAQMLRDWAAHYEQVEVFCISGNHGRFPDARRMQQKDASRNWDTLIYLLVKEMLRDISNITVYIPDSYSVAFEVEGWRFVQTHGHGIKSWNQIPYYGINRMVTNLNALEAGRGKPINFWLFGHFHSASNLPSSAGEVFINGSLVGANEFVVNELGKADKPMQLMFGVHAEHGVTHRWHILADDVEDGYEVKPWEGL